MIEGAQSENTDVGILRNILRKGYYKTLSLSKFQKKHPEINLVKFEWGRHAKRFFGENIYTFYFDASRKDEFARFLEQSFLEKNPHPSANLRSIFTEKLHRYDLHWSLCRDRSESETDIFLKALKWHGGMASRHQVSLFFAHRGMKSESVDRAFEVLQELGIVTMRVVRTSTMSKIVYYSTSQREREVREKVGTKSAAKEEVAAFLEGLEKFGGEATKYQIDRFFQDRRMQVDAVERAFQALSAKGVVMLEPRRRRTNFAFVYRLIRRRQTSPF
jgi:hypothetical protein